MAILAWINDDQSRYFAVAQGVLFALAALIVASAFFPGVNRRLSGRLGVVAFFGLEFLVLLASRWPTFFVTHRLNPDEAQMIAQAITARHDPVPWVGFDSGSSGPLNTYVLDLPALFGFTPNFMTSRIMSIVVIFCALAALYAALSLCFDAGIARLGVLPPLVFWADSTQDDFVHYSSELVSIMLCSSMVALVCWAWRRRYPAGIVYAIGLVAGMVPFAKLQGVPLAAVIGFVALIAIAVDRSLDVRAKTARAGLLAAGAVTFPLLTIGAIAAAGGLRDFWLSYILTSLAYILYTYEPLSFLTATIEFGPFFDWLCLLTIAGGVVVALRFRALGPSRRNAYFAALVVLLGAIDAVYSPKRGSPHYLLFAVIPIAAAAAAALAAIASFAAGERAAGGRRGLLAVAFVATCLIVQSAVVRPHYNWLGGDFDAYASGQPPDPLAGVIGRYLRPGDRLAIWGWVPEYWIDTGTLLGTRDSVSIFQQTPYFNPYRDYFRARYVADFTRIRPQGFLDAGAESWDWGGGTADDYKSFRELAEIVDRDYALVGTWRRFRFFMRRSVLER